MFHCANCWMRLAGQVPLRLPAEPYGNVVSMREQVCSSEEVHYGSARSTAGDGGISDTRTTLRLYHSIKREHIDCVSGS